MARAATPPQSDVARPPLLLVVANQRVERLDQGGHLGVLASELGILEVAPEFLLERRTSKCPRQDSNLILGV